MICAAALEDLNDVNRTARALLLAGLVVAVVVVLFTVVFPWVDRQFFANPVLG